LRYSTDATSTGALEAAIDAWGIDRHALAENLAGLCLRLDPGLGRLMDTRLEESERRQTRTLLRVVGAALGVIVVLITRRR